MSYSGTTTYLGLRKITAKDSSWFADWTYNLERTDLLARHLRLQSGDGAAMGLRTKLLNGSLVEGVQIVPNGTALRIYLGRANTNDEVVLQGQGLQQTNIRLLNVANTEYNANIRTTWTKDGPDNLQNVELQLDLRNNKLTRFKVPVMGNPTIDNSYVGSAVQFELDPAGTAADTSWVSYNLQNAANQTKNYVQPVYKI